MRATPNGFLLEFTRETGMEATDLARYRIVSWTYDYHPDYGSAETDVQEQKVIGAEQGNESSVRDFGGDDSAFFRRNGPITVAMEYQRRH